MSRWHLWHQKFVVKLALVVKLNFHFQMNVFENSELNSNLQKYHYLLVKTLKNNVESNLKLKQSSYSSRNFPDTLPVIFFK